MYEKKSLFGQLAEEAWKIVARWQLGQGECLFRVAPIPPGSVSGRHAVDAAERHGDRLGGAGKRKGHSIQHGSVDDIKGPALVSNHTL
jgi:hypothetical protein